MNDLNTDLIAATAQCHGFAANSGQLVKQANDGTRRNSRLLEGHLDDGISLADGDITHLRHHEAFKFATIQSRAKRFR